MSPVFRQGFQLLLQKQGPFNQIDVAAETEAMISGMKDMRTAPSERTSAKHASRIGRSLCPLCDVKAENTQESAENIITAYNGRNTFPDSDADISCRANSSVIAESVPSTVFIITFFV